MKSFFLRLTVWVLLIGTSGSLLAQSDSGTAPPKPNLNNWWARNAASFNPVPKQWLFHAEADYSFSLQTGNIEGSTHNGKGRLFLRKGRSTAAVRGGIQRQNLSLARGVMELTQEHYRVSPTLDYDITPALGVQGGFLWEHDDAAFIETRTISYGGLKVVPYSSENLVISLLPAFGYQYEQAIFTGEERSFWTPYLEEKISWQPLKQLQIEHEVSGLFSLEDSETYRIRMANSVQVPVTSFLGVLFSHELRYNNNPIPSNAVVRRLTNGQGRISKQDNEFTVGFRLQY